jgi:NAD dependent epimerase/dehydratase family enzyme
MLLGAFGRQWLSWISFQELTEGMEVCNVKNMVEEEAICQEMPAQPQEHG